MRIFIVVVAILAIAAFSGSSLARVHPVTNDGPNTSSGGGAHTRSNDCPGYIVWDTGMYDTFAPPTGCSSSASSQCFVNAQNPYGFPPDGRRLGDDFIADGRHITQVKIWGRYNQAGYDYYVTNPSSLHGFVVKFYLPRQDQQPIWCPDGSVGGETAIGDIVYSQYVSNFTTYELPTPALARSFNYCMNLPIPFNTVPGQAYWVSVAADFDLISYESSLTQWFWRLYQGYYEPYCEASWWDTWSGTEVPWNAVSIGVNMPCWAGWNAAFVLYTDQQYATGACCAPNGDCTVTTESDCQSPNVWYGGEVCDPNPCPKPVPVENSTWGHIKQHYH